MARMWQETLTERHLKLDGFTELPEWAQPQVESLFSDGQIRIVPLSAAKRRKAANAEEEARRSAAASPS